MTKRLPHAFSELTMEVLLRVFWHKDSFRLFLSQHRIKPIVLSQWHPGQTKRDFALLLWSKLLQTDIGHDCILNMARSLSEFSSFPDLERNEDTKEKIPAASEAVARLRRELAKIEGSLVDARNATQRQEALKAESVRQALARQSLEKLNTSLSNISSLVGTQEGGYAFEKWFYELEVYFELAARPSYWADGRQIDGAITLEGTTFLIETKYTKLPIGSPDIDVFMAKIQTKADNTMGICLSISGFNSGAVAAAAKPKTPVLLLDHGHLFSLILSGIMTLPQVVARVKRHAHQTGEAFLPASEF